jgi:hypothetical protein
MEICCGKDRNRPERVKATTGSRAGSEIRDRSHGDMLLEREEWAERAKAITGGKAPAWKEMQFCRTQQGRGEDFMRRSEVGRSSAGAKGVAGARAASHHCSKLQISASFDTRQVSFRLLQSAHRCRSNRMTRCCRSTCPAEMWPMEN